MKWLVLLLVAPLAYGSGNGHHNAGPTEGGAATSDSESTATASAGDVRSDVVIDNHIVLGGGTAAGDSVDLTVNQEVEAVASSPGTIISNHICAEAFAGQSKLVGFSAAKVDHVCMVSRVIQANRTHALILRGKGDTKSLAAAELMDVEIDKQVKELNSWIKWKRWEVRIVSVLKIALMIGVVKVPF